MLYFIHIFILLGHQTHQLFQHHYSRTSSSLVRKPSNYEMVERSMVKRIFRRFYLSLRPFQNGNKIQKNC